MKLDGTHQLLVYADGLTSTEQKCEYYKEKQMIFQFLQGG